MWDDDETYSDFARSREDLADDLKDDNKPDGQANQLSKEPLDLLNFGNEYATSGNNKTDNATA